MDALLSEPTCDFNKHIEKYCHSENVSQSWAYLCEQMSEYGFGRLLFARKPHATKSNFHNLTETIILSTYGPAVDQMFVQNRGYTDDLTTEWTLENNGAVSWQVSRTAYLAGGLSTAQEKVHLATRELGLIAGVTFSSPIPRSSVQSGFGLCHDSDDQTLCDAIWAAHEKDIISILKLFELSVSRLPHIPKEQELTPREISILRMIAEGKTTTDIAGLMEVHRRTVENELASSRVKLAAPNTSSAVYVALTQGQI